MIKRVLAVLAAVFICVFIVPSSAVNASAAKNFYKGFDGNTANSGLIDERGLFAENQDDFEELDSLIKEAAESHQMNIVVFAAGIKRSDYQTEIYADDAYDEMFGEDTDGVFYYLDVSCQYGFYDYISTSGKAVLQYQKQIDSIFTALDNYLPKSGQEVKEADIYEAIKAFLNQLDKYSDINKSFFNYYLDPSSQKYFYYSNGSLVISHSRPLVAYIKPFFISLAVSSLIMLIVYCIIKSTYKFKNSTNPVVYVSQNDTHFTQRSDLMMRTYTTKHRIESSGGGGHRSGGGHSHGGGHGGGGHHR